MRRVHECFALLYERLWSFSFHPLSFWSSFCPVVHFSRPCLSSFVITAEAAQHKINTWPRNMRACAHLSHCYYVKVTRPGVELATSWSQVQCPIHYAIHTAISAHIIFTIITSVQQIVRTRKYAYEPRLITAWISSRCNNCHFALLVSVVYDL